MTCKRIAVSLVAFLAAAPLLPSPAAGASPSADTSALPRAVPKPMPVWSHPPEAVRNAQAALRDACAAWPKVVPLASEPSVPLVAEEDQQYASSCHLALDLAGFNQGLLLQGIWLGAIAAGIAAVVFKVAKLLLLGLGEVANRTLNALWDRRRRRLDGWPE